MSLSLETTAKAVSLRYFLSNGSRSGLLPLSHWLCHRVAVPRGGRNCRRVTGSFPRSGAIIAAESLSHVFSLKRPAHVSDLFS